MIVFYRATRKSNYTYAKKLLYNIKYTKIPTTNSLKKGFGNDNMRIHKNKRRIS
jgi:hypothetical protein